MSILASKGTFVGVLEISLAHEWDGLTHVRMCRLTVNANVKRLKRQDAYFFWQNGGKASTLLTLNRIEVWIQSTFTLDRITLLKIHKTLISFSQFLVRIQNSWYDKRIKNNKVSSYFALGMRWKHHHFSRRIRCYTKKYELLLPVSDG